MKSNYKEEEEKYHQLVQDIRPSISEKCRLITNELISEMLRRNMFWCDTIIQSNGSEGICIRWPFLELFCDISESEIYVCGDDEDSSLRIYSSEEKHEICDAMEKLMV